MFQCASDTGHATTHNDGRTEGGKLRAQCGWLRGFTDTPRGTPSLSLSLSLSLVGQVETIDSASIGHLWLSANRIESVFSGDFRGLTNLKSVSPN